MHLTVFLASDLQTHYSWMGICITKGKSIGNYFVTLVKFWSFNKEYIHLGYQLGSRQVTSVIWWEPFLRDTCFIECKDFFGNFERGFSQATTCPKVSLLNGQNFIIAFGKTPHEVQTAIK